MSRLRSLIILLFASLLLVACPSTNAEEMIVDELAKEFFCACGCGILLSECESNMRCETAKEMKARLQRYIDRGLTKEEIIEKMKMVYGSGILATPPKNPFTLLSLWLYPAFGLGLGGIVIYLIARRRGAKWYVTPDETPELSEEEIAEMWGEEERESAEVTETIMRYEDLLKEEYEKRRRSHREE